MAMIVGAAPQQLRGVPPAPHASLLAPQTSKPPTSKIDVTLHTSKPTPHTSHVTPLHSVPQISYLTRKTGKFVRMEWHGDDAT